MRQLALDEFSGAIGEPFQVIAGDGELELKLQTAEELPASGRAAGSFRLEFRGPADPILPQQIYRFERGDDMFDIFIVPIGRDDDGTRYEAIFY